MNIAYYCDVNDINGAVIPLGVMADISFARVYGMGLRARTKLSDDELALIGGLMRARIQKPFEMLKKDFLALWQKSDRNSFLDMPARFMGALRFEPVPRGHQSLKLPKQLAIQNELSADAIAQWAKDKVSEECKNGYWNLVAEHQARASLEVKDEVREKIAA
jgi:hypothetical protein